MAQSGDPWAACDPEVATGARSPLPSAGARGRASRRRGRGRRASRFSSCSLPRVQLGARRVRQAGGRRPRVARSAVVRGDMSAAGLLAPAPAPAPTGTPPAPEYYPEEDEELESAEDDERSCRGRESDEGASCSWPGSPGGGRGGLLGKGRASGSGAARPAGAGQRDGPRLREVIPPAQGTGRSGWAPCTLQVWEGGTWGTVVTAGGPFKVLPLVPPPSFGLSLRSSLVGTREPSIECPSSLSSLED